MEGGVNYAVSYLWDTPTPYFARFSLRTGVDGSPHEDPHPEFRTFLFEKVRLTVTDDRHTGIGPKSKRFVSEPFTTISTDSP